MNFIEAEIVDASAREVRVKLKSGVLIRAEVDAASASAGDKATLGIRPEHFKFGATENAIETTVTFVESLGSTTHAYFAYPGVDEAMSCELTAAPRCAPATH